MFQAAVQNQTRFVVAPCAPQLSASGGVTPGTFTWPCSTFSVETTLPVAISEPQPAAPNCSPRLKSFVCVQPTGRGLRRRGGCR